MMNNRGTLHIAYLREGADKSLARTTSRCRRTESIVSLEREVCSCAELKVFSWYRDWKDACQATRAISTTSRRASCHQVSFFGGWGGGMGARQATIGNSRHSDRNIRGTCTIVCHRQKLGGPVSTWWFFHMWCASSWTTQNSDHRSLLIKFTSLSWKTAGFRLNK